MAVSPAAVGAELIKAFGGHRVKGVTIGESPFFERFKQIGAVLTHKPLVLEAVEQLDRDMVLILMARSKMWDDDAEFKLQKQAAEYFQKRGPQYKDALGSAGGGSASASVTSTSTPDHIAKYKKQKDPRYSHLLDEALRAEEKRGGFADAVDYITNGLTSTTFLASLRLKRPFKDYGALPNHGEYTHRIQWYIVSKLVFNSQTQTSDAFAAIADWEVKRPDRGEYVSPPYNIWDVLFDRGPDTDFAMTGPDDFRSAAALNLWLCDAVVQQRAPVLSAFLRTRLAKRKAQAETHVDFYAGAGASLKLCNKFYSQLSNEEADKVSEYLKTGWVRRETRTDGNNNHHQ